MNLYTEEVQDHLKSNYRWPAGLEVQVYEYPNHLALRLFRKNFGDQSIQDQLAVQNNVESAINWVRGKGIPCYLEVV